MRYGLPAIMLVIAACGAGPTAPAPTLHSAPPAPTVAGALAVPTVLAADISSDAPTARVTPPPTGASTPGPTVSPTRSQTALPFPSGIWAFEAWRRLGIGKVAFGPDGTAYIAYVDADTYLGRVAALDPHGHVLPGWPVGASVSGTEIVPMPDASLLIGEEPESGGYALHRVGRDGRDRAGWPFRLTAPGRGCGRPVVSPDATVYLMCRVDVSGGARLYAIGPEGQSRPGWPIQTPEGDVQLGGDGTVFVEEPGEYGAPRTLGAYAPDGRRRPGWPLTLPPETLEIVPGPAGSLLIWRGVPRVPPEGGLCGWYYSAGVMSVLGPDGRTMPGWPVRAAELSAPVVGPDGTIYYVTKDQAYARDLAGKLKPGWPVPVDVGTEAGCMLARPYVRPDGTIYINGGRGVTALAPDGGTLPGWPVRRPDVIAPRACATDYTFSPSLGFGPDGVLYQVALADDPAGPMLQVSAIDRAGRALPGWPRDVRVGAPGAWAIVEPFGVSPDGRPYAGLPCDSPARLLVFDRAIGG